MTNKELAQEINTTIGESQLPFEDVMSGLKGIYLDLIKEEIPAEESFETATASQITDNSLFEDNWTNKRARLYSIVGENTAIDRKTLVFGSFYTDSSGQATNTVNRYMTDVQQSDDDMFLYYKNTDVFTDKHNDFDTIFKFVGNENFDWWHVFQGLDDEYPYTYTNYAHYFIPNHLYKPVYIDMLPIFSGGEPMTANIGRSLYRVAYRYQPYGVRQQLEDSTATGSKPFTYLYYHYLFWEDLGTYDEYIEKTYLNFNDIYEIIEAIKKEVAHTEIIK